MGHHSSHSRKQRIRPSGPPGDLPGRAGRCVRRPHPRGKVQARERGSQWPAQVDAECGFLRGGIPDSQLSGAELGCYGEAAQVSHGPSSGAQQWRFCPHSSPGLPLEALAHSLSVSLSLVSAAASGFCGLFFEILQVINYIFFASELDP